MTPNVGNWEAKKSKVMGGGEKELPRNILFHPFPGAILVWTGGMEGERKKLYLGGTQSGLSG